MNQSMPDVCPACGLPRETDSALCMFCGADMTAPPSGELEKLEAVTTSRWKPVASTPKTVEVDRYDAWNIVAVVSAFILLIALFLPWTRSSISHTSITAGASFGWACIISVIGVIGVLLYKGALTGAEPPVGKFHIALGALAVVVTGLVMAARPGMWGNVPNRTPWIGAYLAMAAGLSILISGIFSEIKGRKEERD